MLNVGTLEDYIAMLWTYEPKSSVPVLKDFMQTKLVADPERYKRNPKRFIDNTVYDYRAKARTVEVKKYHKHAHTSVGNDPVVINANLLADKVKDLYEGKVPLSTRTALMGVGVTRVAIPKERVRSARYWAERDERLIYEWSRSKGSLKQYIKDNNIRQSYGAVRTKRSRLKHKV